ncbi:hypothetical protein ES706_04324 [subsurface metagenome]
MRLFSIAEAKYYSSHFRGSVGDSERSLTEFHKKYLLNKFHTFHEGTTIFDEYRDCLLRNVERSLFFSASHYRRALDLMISSACPWAHVTLYYGSWHVAHALLGLFGCTIINNYVIDVAKGLAGNQVLRIQRIGGKPGQVNTTYKGPHQIFWDLFYEAFRAIKTIFPSRFQPAISPINGDRAWQSDRRNEVNYDSFSGIQLSQDFERGFACDSFPVCLPGVMNTQYGVFELLLEMSFYYARDFGIATDALDRLRTPLPLRKKVRELIYHEKPSGLVNKTIKSKIT